MEYTDKFRQYLEFSESLRTLNRKNMRIMWINQNDMMIILVLRNRNTFLLHSDFIDHQSHNHNHSMQFMSRYLDLCITHKFHVTQSIPHYRGSHKNLHCTLMFQSLGPPLHRHDMYCTSSSQDLRKTYRYYGKPRSLKGFQTLCSSL